MIRGTFFLFLIHCIALQLYAQTADKPQIKWLSVQEAIEASKTQPKKIFFDVYTDWCGWCKRMDATTFQHPQIINYMNEHFYAVKFNAESKEKLIVKGKEYGSSNPSREKSPHTFAMEMLQGKLTYPSFAIYSSEWTNLAVIPGFHNARNLEPILSYFGTDSFRSQSWQDYNKAFEGEIKF